MISDLLYLGEKYTDYQDAKELFSKRYPEFKQEDGSDYIHGYRLAVEGEADLKEYFLFLLINGLISISFLAQISNSMHDDNSKVLLAAFEEYKKSPYYHKNDDVT